ncbi:jg22470 [Pararge aegeria aegeria]|uniref:Jg22470 protein n=1 Tax=Pararge aegeria aegeria TaxID=348720 RepID=A0A8S4SGP8_9NEOP|nr:jg22470 [Pararge aegeria aegeria]
MKPLYCSDGGDVKVNSPPCHSPGAILPDLPQAAEDPDKNCGLSKDATAPETQAWLARHRFTQHVPTFTNFSGADLLRLSRDDIIQICGLADGIRLFNALHAKRIEPRLTVYVCPSGCTVYSVLYLHACRAAELLHKLRTLLPPTSKIVLNKKIKHYLHRRIEPRLTVYVCPSGCTVYSVLYLHACRAAELLHKLRTLLPPTSKECDTVLVSGPNGAPVRLTDELVRHLPDNSTYRLERIEDDTLLLSPTGN